MSTNWEELSDSLRRRVSDALNETIVGKEPIESAMMAAPIARRCVAEILGVPYSSVWVDCEWGDFERTTIFVKYIRIASPSGDGIISI